MKISKIKWPLIVLALLLGAATVFYLRTMRAIDVEVASIEQSTEVRISGIGTVEAQIVSRIGFQISGRIVSLDADQGDTVEAGAVIAKLDDSAQRAKVAKVMVSAAQAEATHAKALAVLRKGEVTLQQKISVNQRRQSLVAREFVSQEAADEARSSEALARADLEIAKADVALAEAGRRDAIAAQAIEHVTLDQHRLAAPFRGRVLARAKELGSVANPGETVFTLVEPSSIWVRAYVDEALAGGLKVGQTAFVRLRSERTVTVEAKIVRIDQENDRVTEERRIYVRCVACVPEHQVRFLGEQAEVEVVKATLAQAVFVPLHAVEAYDGSSGFIWVLANGKLDRRKLALADRLLDGRIKIADPLPDGVRAVVSRSDGRFSVGRPANASTGAGP
jgi:HlyD family secretion protein